MRSFARAIAAITLPLALAGCSRLPDLEIDNRSGDDIALEQSAGDWRRAPAGRVTGDFKVHPNQRIRAGHCSYIYTGLNIHAARPRHESRLLGAPKQIYHVRLEADFSLRLFNAAEPGLERVEVTSDGWPAKPQVECRTEG